LWVNIYILGSSSLGKSQKAGKRLFPPNVPMYAFCCYLSTSPVCHSPLANVTLTSSQSTSGSRHLWAYNILSE
jgi:hypothetical protein